MLSLSYILFRVVAPRYLPKRPPGDYIYDSSSLTTDNSCNHGDSLGEERAVCGGNSANGKLADNDVACKTQNTSATYGPSQQTQGQDGVNTNTVSHKEASTLTG